MNPLLFALLAPVDQALLVLHEEIYLIAREILHKSSDALRATVSELLSDELRGRLREKESRDDYLWERGQQIDDNDYPARLLQVPIWRILGDYYLYFVSDPLDRPRVVPAAPSQYSRYLAFGDLLQAFRSRKGDCLTARHYEDPELSARVRAKIIDDCTAEAMSSKDILASLSDEQSLVFLARWRFDSLRAMASSENLLIWDREQPAHMTELQKSELEAACRAARNFSDERFPELFVKARKYCKALGL